MAFTRVADRDGMPCRAAVLHHQARFPSLHNTRVAYLSRLWRMVGGLRLLLIPLVPTLLMALAGHIAMVSIFIPNSTHSY